MSKTTKKYYDKSEDTSLEVIVSAILISLLLVMMIFDWIGSINKTSTN